MIKSCIFCKKDLVFKGHHEKKFCDSVCNAKNSIKNNPRFGFKKGHKTRVGLKHPQSFIENRKKEGNPGWKGDKATFSSIHCWVRENFIKTNECEICGKIKKLDWSNKNHTYKRIREDWQCVCRSCHQIYDYKYNNRTRSKNGLVSKKTE